MTINHLRITVRYNYFLPYQNFSNRLRLTKYTITSHLTAYSTKANTDWFRSYLTKRTQYVECNGSSLSIREIEQVTEFNFLGLTANGYMNWTSHTPKIANKISRTLGVMNRLKRYFPPSAMKLMYDSLILPHLQFEITNWGFEWDHISKLQKLALHIMTNSQYNVHAGPLFKPMHLLKVKDIFDIQCLKFWYEYVNNNCQIIFAICLHIIMSCTKSRLEITIDFICIWPWQLNRLEHSAWIRRLGVRVPLRSRHFLSQKLWYFHKNTRSCVQNECCCPRKVNISNVNFT